MLLSMADRNLLVMFASAAHDRLLNPGEAEWDEAVPVGVTVCVRHDNGDYEPCYTKQGSAFARVKPDSAAIIREYCERHDYGSNRYEPHVLYYLNTAMLKPLRSHVAFLAAREEAAYAHGVRR